MRFASYLHDQQPTWGVLIDNQLVNHAAILPGLPTSLEGYLKWCERNADAQRNFAKCAARFDAKDAGISLDKVDWQPCLVNPGKIICLGVNYTDHAKEGGNVIADYPAFFLRCSTSLLAHRSPITIPTVSSKLDFEAELAVVIGSRTRFVSELEALKSVFGYACFNDASLRDYQKRTSQWTIGKNFDGTGGFGPCIVTADELPPGCDGLKIQSYLNGRIMQDDNTNNMVFGVARTISLLSECMTLEPGDVLVMGTPSGVGYARTPPVWMQAGDTIEVHIERVGMLSNRIVA
jgi:acylpyruvate hydrolase